MRIDKKLAKQKKLADGNTSASKEKKQRTDNGITKVIIPIVLVVLLASLIVGYVILKKANDEAIKAENEEETVETVEVLDKGPAIPTSIHISSEQEELSLIYVDDSWEWADDEHFPIDQEAATEMADVLSKVQAYLIVNDPRELSEYGLEEPIITAEATFSDGTNYTYKLGNTNEYNGYQYFMLNTDSTVYMVDTSAGITLDKSLDDLIVTDSSPLIMNTVVADDVKNIIVESEGGQSNEITDEKGVADLFEYIYSLTFKTWEDYYADDEEMLNTFGINKNGDKVCVNYTTEENVTNDDGTTSNVKVDHSFTVYIGHKFTNEDKTSGYFYTQDGSTIVYSADVDTVEAILNYISYVPAETTEADTTAVE